MKPNTPSGTTLLILFWNLGIGGVQTKIVDIANRVTRPPFHIRHCRIVLREKPDFRLDDRVHRSGASLHYRPSFFSGRIHIPYSLYVLYAMIRYKPDTVLAFLDHASFLAVLISKILFWRRIRVVLNEDTMSYFHTTSGIKRLLITLLYPHADLVIAPTDATKQDLVRRFRIPAGNISVRPNWTLRRPEPPKRIPSCDLMYVGRFAEQKRLRTLLRCVSALKKTHPAISLYMIGEGESKSGLEHYIRTHGLEQNVIFRPSTPDVTRQLHDARVYVLTSRYEGMPVALLEAMACALPVVITAIPGAGEYIKHEETGFIARSDQQFLRSVRRLLDTPTLRRRIGHNARNAVRDRFGIRACDFFIRTLLG